MKGCFFFLLLCSNSFAQVHKPSTEAARIRIDETQCLPAVYALAENHYDLQAFIPVVGLKVVSDTNTWQITVSEDDHFVIKCRKYGRTTTVDLDSTILLRAKLANGDTIDLFAPIKVYAEVKITPSSPVQFSDGKPFLSCQEKLSFRADWVYPAYVRKIFRVYAIFEMEVLSNNERVDGMMGWYDSGDQTKHLDFSRHFGKPNLLIRVKNVRTLHRYRQNGRSIPVLLSMAFPSEWNLY
ncbi:MAG: hypothetical protein N4A41_13855 [Crocinitomicaceae bacterium]|jgi:hypothetical protein|nr:hypothetical protein [Crocinitomicaceae bacterium]